MEIGFVNNNFGMFPFSRKVRLMAEIYSDGVTDAFEVPGAAGAFGVYCFAHISVYKTSANINGDDPSIYAAYAVDGWFRGGGGLAESEGKHRTESAKGSFRQHL